jgi:antitoxin (DNA-binding transcriptional repressor) of toxin-antitoxin stability system
MTKTVTVRELRNRGGEVLARVVAGERLTVTRDGRPVAELRRVAGSGPTAEAAIARARNLPDMDPDALMRDIDAVLDATL